MRFLLIIFIFLKSILINSELFARERQTFSDSVKLELARTKTDTSKLEVLKLLINNTGCKDSNKLRLINEYGKIASGVNKAKYVLAACVLLSDYYMDCGGDCASAIEVYERYADMPMIEKDSSLLTTVYEGLAETYYRCDKKNTALIVYQKALALSHDAIHRRSIYGNMGQIYMSMADYPRALECYQQAYYLHNQHIVNSNGSTRQDSLVLMLLLTSMASVNVSLRDYDKAIANYDQVKKINLRIGDKLMEVYRLTGTGNCLHLKNEPSTAIGCYTKALAICIEIKELEQEGDIHNNLGNIYLASGSVNEANNQAQKALAVGALMMQNSRKVASPYFLPDTYVLLGKIFSRSREYGKAVQYLQKAIALYHQDARLDGEADAWHILSDTYTGMRRPDSALAAFRNHIALRDSIFSQDKAKEITRIELMGEFNRKLLSDSLVQAKKDMQAKAELQRQKRDKGFYVAGSILMLIIAAGSIYFLGYTRRANRQIEMLMKEMHHRVKNNLQIISTLLNLQLADIIDEGARKTIEEGITRISSISLIHHHLYRVADLATIEISGFIKELQVQVAAVYNQPGQVLNLDFDIPETRLDIDTAIPLSLILNELMTNSYKYAFAGKSSCDLSVKLTSEGSKHTITYRDYGPGLPDNFDIENADSLGMKIITNLASQLGGAFHYSRANSCFVVNFKDTALRKATA